MKRWILVSALGIAGCRGAPFTPEQRVAQWQREPHASGLDAQTCRDTCDEDFASRYSWCEHETAEQRERCRQTAAEVRERCYASCPKD